MTQKKNIQKKRNMHMRDNNKYTVLECITCAMIICAMMIYTIL